MKFRSGNLRIESATIARASSKFAGSFAPASSSCLVTTDGFTKSLRRIKHRDDLPDISSSNSIRTKCSFVCSFFQFAIDVIAGRNRRLPFAPLGFVRVRMVFGNVDVSLNRDSTPFGGKCVEGKCDGGEPMSVKESARTVSVRTKFRCRIPVLRIRSWWKSNLLSVSPFAPTYSKQQ